MKFSDKVYDKLKWVCLIGIPALETFLGMLLPTLNVPTETTTIVLTIVAGVGTFIGSLIGISNAQYTAEKK